MTDCARVEFCRVVSVIVRSGGFSHCQVGWFQSVSVKWGGFSQSVSGGVVSVRQCQVGWFQSVSVTPTVSVRGRLPDLVVHERCVKSQCRNTEFTWATGGKYILT